jgi:uncharacterized protein
MNQSSLVATILILSSCLLSCGKKAGETSSGDNESVYDQISTEQLFAIKYLREAVKFNDVNTLQKLFSQNPDLDVNQTLENGETLLTHAIKENQIEIRNLLLEKEAIRKDLVNFKQETPLMVAARYGRLNSLKVLLDLRVSLNEIDRNGNTALHLAIINGYNEIALTLIKHGANLLISDYDQRNAYALAQDHGTTEVLDLIRTIMQIEEGTPDIASFRKVLEVGDIKSLNSLLTRFPRIVHDYESINPLVLTISTPDYNIGLRMAEILLAYNIQVNGPRDAEITPLIEAVKKQALGFVLLLLNAHADPNRVDNLGKSALIHAVELNNLSITTELLNRSAMDKYSYSINGRKLSFSACAVARLVRKDLSDSKEIATNKAIQDKLKCGLFSWFGR